MKLGLVTLACVFIGTMTAGAECITIPVNVTSALKEADLVFVGTAVTAGPYQLTIQPERVWKGNVKQTPVTIHIAGPGPWADSYSFRAGERYLMFARVVPEAERTFSDTDQTPYGIERPCGEAPWPLSLTRQLDRIAKGHRP
jgi:hypothetical protein